MGRPVAKLSPAFASFRFGDGRVGDVHKAAASPIAIVGYTAQFIACVADADIPAPLGRATRGILGGRLNFRLCVMTMEALGADLPLEMDAVSRYLLNVADFPESRNVRMSGRRANCCAKRAACGEGMVRSDALFLMDVTSGTKMHPAGRGGSSLTFACLETRWSYVKTHVGQQRRPYP